MSAITLRAPARAAVAERPAQTDAAARPNRDLYIDSLRSAALVRVVAYHTFGWLWLPLVFPSLGIMFALAGSLLAGSLDRDRGRSGHVVTKRLRRLLPPLWALGIVLVPLMLRLGWTVTEELGTELTWASVWLWVVPLASPPGSAAQDTWVLPLWYISSYLWLVLLSPALLWLFRRWPRVMIVLPLLAVASHAAGLVDFAGPFGDIALDVLTYASCWMLGFAHHDGMLRRIPMVTILPAAAAIAGAGVWWAFAYPDLQSGSNLSDIPLASALFSMGVVMALLRLYLDFSWMHRVPVLAWLVQAISARAMTIYLWGNVAIFTAGILLDSWAPTSELSSGPYGDAYTFGAAWVVIALLVLSLGWIEDVAAGRRPSVVPRIGRSTVRRTRQPA